MNPKLKKKVKADYYKPWDVTGGVALSALTKALDKQKAQLVHHNITINKEELNEHYCITVKAWEAHSVVDHDEWTVVKAESGE